MPRAWLTGPEGTPPVGRTGRGRAGHGAGRLRVVLVQRGAWDMAKESMPLAAGYLAATALAEPAIAGCADMDVVSFSAGHSHLAMAHRLFTGGVPDVLAFSVLGWNYRAFAALAETFRQLNPAGWVVFGGTHVANQAERVLRELPPVDVVVNGEGEMVFRDLLLARLAGWSRHGLGDVAGISYRDRTGAVITTPARAPVQDLSSVPSPLLTGAIPLVDESGRFRYDVALLETNRGCPYHCAFCWWGGAVGQKVRAFPRERLRAELELLARLRVHTVVLCDANFGMFPADLDFVEDLVRIRERFGHPQALETSWAKNKSQVFYRIVEMLRASGLHSSFTLALQTLNEPALESMQRRNMRLNAWEDLVERLRDAGMDCYAELIWGAPGETYESFLTGYDRLARLVPRIATYPLLLLPNTAYAAARREHGFVTVRGEADDFEYVLASRDIPLADNVRMQRFLLWSRAVAENLVLRTIWTPLRVLTGMTQSEVLLDMASWFGRCGSPAAAGLEVGDALLGQPQAVLAFLRHLYSRPELDDLFRAWWTEQMDPRVTGPQRRFLRSVLEYDLITKPVYDPAGPAGVDRDGLEVVEQGGRTWYVRRAWTLDHDVPGGVAAMRRGAAGLPDQRPVRADVWYLAGFAAHLDNHEMAAHFVGTLRPSGVPGLAVAAGVDGDPPA